MTQTEALRLALEAAEMQDWEAVAADQAMTIAMMKSEQEPVATISIWHKMGEQHADLWNWQAGLEKLPDGEHHLYASPQRTWVGLTNEEFDFLVPYCHNEFDLNDYKEFARAIEAKLKEKNGG